MTGASQLLDARVAAVLVVSVLFSTCVAPGQDAENIPDDAQNIQDSTGIIQEHIQDSDHNIQDLVNGDAVFRLEADPLTPVGPTVKSYVC